MLFCLAWRVLATSFGVQGPHTGRARAAGGHPAQLPQGYSELLCDEYISEN